MWALLLLLLLSAPSAFGQPPISGGGGGQIRALSQIQGFCSSGEMMQQSGSNWICIPTPAGGASQILDLADDASNESTNLGEIATTGDTNSIFTEPSPDKLLIDLGQAWPTADALSSNGANCSAGQAPAGVDASGAVEGCFTPSSASLILDLADDASNESTGMVEIATTGDTNSIFTEPSADKLLIDAGQSWPTADALTANGANCSTGEAPIGVDAAGAAEGCAALNADDVTDDLISSLSNVHVGVDATNDQMLVGDGVDFRASLLLVCNTTTEKLMFDGTDWTCETDTDDVTDDLISSLSDVAEGVDATNNQMLVGDGVEFGPSLLLVCNTTTEKLMFDGTDWTCETDLDTAGAGDITDVFNCATGDCSSIALSDGDRLDMSAVAPTTTADGLFLPQTADCSGAIALGQVCVDTDNGTLFVGDGATANAGTAQTIDETFALGNSILTATCETTPLRISRGGDDYWDICVNSSEVPSLLAVCNGGSCDLVNTIPTNQVMQLYDEEGASAMLTVDPDAADVHSMYQFTSGYQPLVSAEVPLRPAGDCFVSEESIVTNDPVDEWVTCADTTGDAVAFNYKVTQKISVDTTVKITLLGVNKNASPTGTYTLVCAAQSVRPGLDAYAAHNTTGQQNVSFTTFDTQNRPESASATFTLNGTLAVGAHIKGQCNVTVAPAQIADVRLHGTAVIEVFATSWSD